MDNPKTIQRQSKETGDIGYTKHKTKINTKTNKQTKKKPAQYVFDTTICKHTQIT